MKNIKQIEKDLLEKYDKGKLQPLGADGGCLRYVLLGGYDTGTRASITTDAEISKIRRIWALTIGGKKVYDFTGAYYKTRGAN